MVLSACRSAAESLIRSVNVQEGAESEQKTNEV